MYQIIIVIHVLLGLGIIGLIMIQQGKGADAGASFGSGSSGSVFGAQGAGNFLSKSTATLATLFFITSLGLAVLNSRQGAAYDLMAPEAVKKGAAAIPETEASKELDKLLTNPEQAAPAAQPAPAQPEPNAAAPAIVPADQQAPVAQQPATGENSVGTGNTEAAKPLPDSNAPLVKEEVKAPETAPAIQPVETSLPPELNKTPESAAVVATPTAEEAKPTAEPVKEEKHTAKPKKETAKEKAEKKKAAAKKKVEDKK